jgi:hypothetical protein
MGLAKTILPRWDEGSTEVVPEHPDAGRSGNRSFISFIAGDGMLGRLGFPIGAFSPWIARSPVVTNSICGFSYFMFFLLILLWI